MRSYAIVELRHTVLAGAARKDLINSARDLCLIHTAARKNFCELQLHGIGQLGILKAILACSLVFDRVRWEDQLRFGQIDLLIHATIILPCLKLGFFSFLCLKLGFFLCFLLCPCLGFFLFSSPCRCIVCKLLIFHAFKRLINERAILGDKISVFFIGNQGGEGDGGIGIHNQIGKLLRPFDLFLIIRNMTVNVGIADLKRLLCRIGHHIVKRCAVLFIFRKIIVNLGEMNAHAVIKRVCQLSALSCIREQGLEDFFSLALEALDQGHVIDRALKLRLIGKQSCFVDHVGFLDVGKQILIIFKTLCLCVHAFFF